MTLAPDPNGIGLVEFFTVPDTAAGYLKLAIRYLNAGNSERAQAVLVLSYQARAREVANSKG